MKSTATAGMGPTLFTTTTKAALLIAAGPAVVAGVVSATVSTLTEGVLKTMFISKIKTMALVLCSVAALGIGTGGVYYQTRAGAADPQQLGQVVQNNSRGALEPGEREIDKLKQENDRLKKAIEQIRAEKEGLSLRIAKLQSELNIRQAEQVEQKRTLEFERERAELELMKRSLALPQNQRANPPAAGEDKLDQILKRLEHLEKRMDRLEKGKVGDPAGNNGLLKENWPKSLLGGAFKESRDRIDTLMQTVNRSVASGKKPDAATLNDLGVEYRKMRETLDNNLPNLTPDEYIEANKFLRRMGNTIRALKDPNIGK
jgi:chromosome segregation ATPase